MDVSSVTNLIGSVGFPILMCLMMYKYMTDTQEKTDETLQKLETAIKALEKGVDTLVKISMNKLGGGNDED